MRVLVTGAAGFVGAALCRELANRGLAVLGVVRRAGTAPAACLERVVPDIGPDTQWGGLLEGVDAIVHLAARVHVMRDSSADPASAFRRVNTLGTLALARAAADAGVTRFVFSSTIKVLGESTPERAFCDDTPPAPQDPYSVSKWEAEQGLWQIVAEGAMQVVVIRPPLVYGPGAKGNVLRLIRLCDLGLPLPFDGIDNRRSMIYLGNLIDVAALCLTHPAAPGHAYVVRDGEDLSTSELIRRIASALGRRAMLVPVPPGPMRWLARCFGKEAEVRRLLDSLAVDDGRIRQELGWSPPFGVDDGLAATIAAYRAGRRIDN